MSWARTAWWNPSYSMSTTGLNSGFSFSQTDCNTKEPSLPYHLPIAGGRKVKFIPFPRVLTLCETQAVWPVWFVKFLIILLFPLLFFILWHCFVSIIKVISKSSAQFPLDPRFDSVIVIFILLVNKSTSFIHKMIYIFYLFSYRWYLHFYAVLFTLTLF